MAKRTFLKFFCTDATLKTPHEIFSKPLKGPCGLKTKAVRAAWKRKAFQHRDTERVSFILEFFYSL